MTVTVSQDVWGCCHRSKCRAVACFEHMLQQMSSQGYLSKMPAKESTAIQCVCLIVCAPMYASARGCTNTHRHARTHVCVCVCAWEFKSVHSLLCSCCRPTGVIASNWLMDLFKLCLFVILQDPNGTYYAMMSRVITTTSANKS